MTQDIVILGGGGHCGVLMSHLPSSFRIVGICDPGITQPMHPRHNVPVLQKDEDVLARFKPDKVLLLNGVGSAASMQARHDLFRAWKQRGYRFAGVTATSAFVAKDITLGEGAQLMPGAVVELYTTIGDNCIINTMAQVNHDNTLGHSVHISPGAVLCGGVSVGNQTHVGAGAVVIQGVTIGKYCLIGAGAVVVENVPDYSTVYPPRGTVVTEPPV